MEKHLRCNMKISKAPLLIWAIPLPPPPIPTARQHETRQRRAETGIGVGGFNVSRLLLLPVSFTTTPFISSIGRATAAALVSLHKRGFFEGEGGKGCVVDGIQIK